MIDEETESRRKAADGQLDFFTVDPESPERAGGKFEYPPIPELGIKELLEFEKSAASLYFSGQILNGYSKHEKDLHPAQLIDLRDSFTSDEEGQGDYYDGQKTTVCGMIREVAVKNTKNKDRMAFVRIEDRHSSAECVILPKVFSKYSHLLNKDAAVAVRGSVRADSEKGFRIVADSLEPLIPDERYVPESREKTPASSPDKKEKTLYIRVPDVKSEIYRKVLNLISIFDGATPVVVYDAKSGKYARLNGSGVAYSENVRSFFAEVAGEENVVCK